MCVLDKSLASTATAERNSDILITDSNSHELLSVCHVALL